MTSTSNLIEQVIEAWQNMQAKRRWYNVLPTALLPTTQPMYYLLLVLHLP